MRRTTFILPVISGILLTGCVAEGAGHAESASAATERSAGTTAQRQYGGSARLGNGTVRTYVTVGGEGGALPVEVGVAIDAAGLEGLAKEMQVMHLELPANAPAPYRFVMFGRNPDGHEPDEIYTVPHFDVHFENGYHRQKSAPGRGASAGTRGALPCRSTRYVAKMTYRNDPNREGVSR